MTNILKTVTDRANNIVDIMYELMKATHGLPFSVSTCQGQGRAHIDVNISITVTYRANITIAVEYEGTHRLSVVIFTFRFGPF